MAQSTMQLLAQLPQAVGEPGFVTRLRQQAWAKYQELPVPTKEEEWRRTNVRHLRLDALPDYTPGVKGEVPAAVRDRIPAGAIGVVQHNSTVTSVVLPSNLKSQGVILTSLEEAVRHHADKVEPYLMAGAFDYADNKFAALHGARWAGGLFLYVPRDVVIADPIYHVIWSDGDGTAVHAHTLVVAAANSQVAVVAWRGSAGNTFCTEGVELYPQDGARVSYTTIQDWSLETTAFHFRRALPGKNARADWVVGDFGGQLVRSEVETLATGEGSESEILTVFFGTAGQHFDLSAAGVHVGRNSHSNIRSRGAVGANGRVVYRGKGQIKDGAKQSSCYQREQALILDEDARHDAIPSLYIEETDVAGAGHAATSGRVDDMHLFYLQSRGIPLDLAKRMIVEGFMTPVLEKLPEDLREHTRELLDRKLSQ